MRLAKKFGAVVAMAAVCLTMVAPTTASAATCSPTHTFVTVVDSRNSYTEHHGYLYGTVDGEDAIWKDCVITTTKIVYALNCKYCEEYISNISQETTVTHSACGL